MKETLISWLIKFVEILLVALLGIIISAIMVMVLKDGIFGIVAVAIVFYFFGSIISPYIKEIQANLTKNIKKPAKKKQETK